MPNFDRPSFVKATNRHVLQMNTTLPQLQQQQKASNFVRYKSEEGEKTSLV